MDQENYSDNGHSGYVCKGGAHAVLDQQLEEGEGAMCCLEKVKNWEGPKHGPFFPHESIKNVFMEVEGRSLDGVQHPDEGEIIFLAEDKKAREALREQYREWKAKQ